MLVSVMEVPVPLELMFPGYRVSVQESEAGKPLMTTLPVERAHDGIVIFPRIGAEGVVGCALITTLPDEVEVHPELLVTVKV